MLLLLEASADKDQANNQGATPLTLAAYNGHLDVVRHLVEVGADKDHAVNSGATPLYIAAWNGHLDVVRHLAFGGSWCGPRSSGQSGCNTIVHCSSQRSS